MIRRLLAFAIAWMSLCALAAACAPSAYAAPMIPSDASFDYWTGIGALVALTLVGIRLLVSAERAHNQEMLSSMSDGGLLSYGTWTADGRPDNIYAKEYDRRQGGCE